jgi:hypothetical protein
MPLCHLIEGPSTQLPSAVVAEDRAFHLKVMGSVVEAAAVVVVEAAVEAGVVVEDPAPYLMVLAAAPGLQLMVVAAALQPTISPVAPDSAVQLMVAMVAAVRQDSALHLMLSAAPALQLV